MALSYLIPLDYIPNAKIQNFQVNLVLQNPFILEAKRLQSFCASEIGMRSCVNFLPYFQFFIPFYGPRAYINNVLLGSVSRFICVLICFLWFVLIVVRCCSIHIWKLFIEIHRYLQKENPMDLCMELSGPPRYYKVHQLQLHKIQLDTDVMLKVHTFSAFILPHLF